MDPLWAHGHDELLRAKAMMYGFVARGVNGNINIPKNGKIKFPTLAESMPLNDNGLVSQNIEGQGVRRNKRWHRCTEWPVSSTALIVTEIVPLS